MLKIDTIAASLAGCLRATAFLIVIICLIPVLWIAKCVDRKNPFRVPHLFHKLLVKLLGIKVRTIGEISTATPVLFVANHTSYLDVPVLGSLVSSSFVAKSEVASWPLFGYLARLQDTVFIERRSVHAGHQRTQLQEHFSKRQNLVLFPEGTSSNGLAVLSFKSALFSVMEEATSDIPITVQPVSITCTELDCVPLLDEDRGLYAWYGDMTLPPHLWGVFKHGHFTVEVIFHPPLSKLDAPDRKALAATCQNIVGRGIEQSLNRHKSA